MGQPHEVHNKPSETPTTTAKATTMTTKSKWDIWLLNNIVYSCLLDIIVIIDDYGALALVTLLLATETSRRD